MQPDYEALVRSGRKKPLYVPEPAHRVELGRAEIEKLIPHRDPFLLVDRIDAVERRKAIAGRRWCDASEPLFRGHFPNDPIYPGALQVEAIGQLGLCLFGMDRPSGGVRALKIHHASFIAAIRPSCEMALFATALDVSDYTGICAGQVSVGEQICCVAIMEVYFVEA